VKAVLNWCVLNAAYSNQMALNRYTVLLGQIVPKYRGRFGKCKVFEKLKVCCWYY